MGTTAGARARRQYGEEVTAVLKVVWEVTNRLCNKRLQPFLPELVGILQNQGELSASTIDRLAPATLQAARDTAPFQYHQTEGFYLTTLSAVDVATGWVECQGGMG